MSIQEIPNGVYPTMVTPFTDDNRVNYAEAEKLVEWYARKGCNGIFAVCQSSELYHLSLTERVELAKRVGKAAAKQSPQLTMVASGHTEDSLDAQAYELTAMQETGAAAIVWISNRLDLHNEGDDVWLRNAEQLLAKLPSTLTLGIYECPKPYKRLLTPRILDWCISTGRFRFIKDTCCDPALLAQRLKQLEGTGIKLFNANAQTLLYSLRLGCAGYSGVMANFHPELYTWLCHHFLQSPAEADHLDEIISMCAFTEFMAYPVTAKYHLQQEGIFSSLQTRTRSASEINDYQKLVIQQMKRLTDRTFALLS